MVLEKMVSLGKQGVILLEPTSKNTAAAMTIAALEKKNSDSLLLFCPADHYIPDSDYFLNTIKSALPAAKDGAIVTFGVSPFFPSTAYGYILRGDANSAGGYLAKEFVEKPSETRASELLLSGNYFWNAGIFLCKPSTLLDAVERYAPDVLKSCQAAMASKQKEEIAANCTFVRPDETVFASCRSQSIDYAVMEHHDRVVVFPFGGQWSDVGSWKAVAELLPSDDVGNRIVGNGIACSSQNVFIHAGDRPVVALGVQGLTVIDTPDAVLVLDHKHVEQVKDLVLQLEAKKYTQAISHRRVARPWGWYDCVDAGERFQVKRIGVKPGASLSLQKHQHRAEHWIIVKGTAEVTRDQEVFILTENQSTYIPIGVTHRLKNPGMVELEIIEVQSGSYLGEDDIVRIEDNYGRA